MASNNRSLDFEGFLSKLEGWEDLLNEKNRTLSSQSSKSTELGSSSKKNFKYPSFSDEEIIPDANSEKELGNEYFKKKKYIEAIDCYSKNIALNPTAVSFANRAMAFLKLKKYEEGERDCTEALNLDDRYIKAYSRRSTARKELNKLKESFQDAEFALTLEPNTQELRKQFDDKKREHIKERIIIL